MNSLFLFLFMVVVGVGLESMAVKSYYLITKTHYKEHHFSWGKYLFLLSFPLLATFYAINQEGASLAKVFVIFGFAGTLLELFIGAAYHNIMGQRLWTYHKYTITKYTSFLSLPLWGMSGVLFWLMVKAFD